MRRYLTPWRVAAVVAVLAVVVLLVLYSVPSGAFPGMSDQYILLPDVAHPVAPLVKVQGERPRKPGTLYFVDVTERRASTLEALFPSLHPHATLVPAGVIVPPCASDAQAETAALQGANSRIATVACASPNGSPTGSSGRVDRPQRS